MVDLKLIPQTEDKWAYDDYERKSRRSSKGLLVNQMINLLVGVPAFRLTEK